MQPGRPEHGLVYRGEVAMIHQRMFRAMGCQMLALLDSEQTGAADALTLVPGWFAAWEAQLSRFRADSELSRLNRMSGAWVPVSDVLWAVLDRALVAAEHSSDLVTPTLLPALEAIGYDRTFTAIVQHEQDIPPLLPTPPERVLQRPVAHSWREIERDHQAQAVRLPLGMRLDFGGIAKGWSADSAAQLLRQHGPALIDAGGDIAVNGPLADGAPWSIGVADPLNPDTDLEVLLLKRGGVATSGRDYRRWQQHGIWQHHILDPRTGQAAQTDVLSATVVAPTACEAEAAAKTALILGSRDGLRWLDTRPTLAGLLVLEHGQIVRSRRFSTYTAR